MNHPNRNPTLAHAIGAWNTAVKSVDACELVKNAISVDGRELTICDQVFQLDRLERIRIVGAGKATGAMLLGAELALGRGILSDLRVGGWINIPHPAEGVSSTHPQAAQNSESKFRRVGFGGNPGVWRFFARPAAENLPTEDCLGGTLLIEDIVRRTTADELCLFLVSGGGSALLTHPAQGIELEDIRKLTTWMSGAKASIRQLNVVRQQISQVKGGRLAANFGGHHLAALIISDVLSDQVDLVASGPTARSDTGPRDALEVLRTLDPKLRKVPKSIVRHLERASEKPISIPSNVSNHLIGNVQIAMKACKAELESRGFKVFTEVQSDEFETAETAGTRLAKWLRDRVETDRPIALVSGGEPVVELCRNPGKGGRNQQLVLAALAALTEEMKSSSTARSSTDSVEFSLLSGGTDGEDGTTAVAGAYLSNETVLVAKGQSGNLASHLKRNDAFTFLNNELGRPFLNAPPKVQTNVCDLRVIAISPRTKH